MTPDPNLDVDIKDYLNTLDDERDNEWYTTERNLHSNVLASFKAWLYAVEYDLVNAGSRTEVYTFAKRSDRFDNGNGRTWVASFATRADAEMYIRQVIV